MAKILFLQNLPFEYMGPMYISSLLKQSGHECRLIIVSENKNFLEQIREYNPDLIGFSTMTGPHKWVITMAKEIKKYFDLPIILGGPHPTFFPEVLSEPCLDMICIGEGEYAILELADQMRTKGDITKIKNLWVKKGGHIFKNPLRPLVENLDELPFPDRTLYDSSKTLSSIPVKRFLTGRGCPYRCTFCFNHKYNELYRGLGRVVRRRNVDNLIAEIKEVRRKYRVELVRFPDDSFTVSKEWLLDFLPQFKEEVNLPFTGLARANELDEEIIQMLSKSGCLSIFLGVESGNEVMRDKILKKNLKDEQIIKVAELLKKYKIKFGTYNMFGLPGETLDLAWETIRFNQRLKPDYTDNNIFQPYPKTEIVKYALEHGCLPEDFDYFETMNIGSVIKAKDIDKIVNLQRLSFLAIKYPFLNPLIKILIRFPPNRFFRVIHDLSNYNVLKGNFNLSWFTLLKWGLKIRRSS